ncbi:MAG: hypothetical protein U0414_23600 [Polyangiaceae bacterium]
MSKGHSVILPVLGAAVLGALSLAACSSPSADAPSASASAAVTVATAVPTFARRRPPRSGVAHVDPSSLPVPEDYESEFRKQITSSNYLDALESAAAEASAAPRAHP